MTEPARGEGRAPTTSPVRARDGGRPHLVHRADDADGPLEEAPDNRGHVLRLVASRLAAAVFVLWAAITVTFLAVQLMPGDTVSLLLGESRNDPDARARTIERWSLDQPVWRQYVDYLARVPRGDLGISYDLSRPVADLIAEAIRPTLTLTVAGLAGAVLLAYLATLASTGRLAVLRPVLTVVELVLLSAPPFWIGIVLLLVFSFQLGWFSVIDPSSWQALVLPALALALPLGAYLAQILRDGVVRAMEQPFAVTALSRGVSTFTALRRHAVRHATLPVLTVLGLMAGGLLGGAVITEQVFGRAGLGTLALNAVTVKDIPLMLGVTLVGTFAFVVMSTIVDLVGIAVDPRIRAARS